MSKIFKAVPELPPGIASKEDLLELISEEEIFLYYVGSFKLGKPLKCPLKTRKEKYPSFIITKFKGKLAWKSYPDYTKNRSCFDFIMIKYNVDFYTALAIIHKDLVVDKGQTTLDHKQVTQIQQQEENTFEWYIVPRASWSKYDQKYWSNYHFTRQHLIKWRYKPLHEYWSSSDGTPKKLRHTSSAKDPMYLIEHDSEDSWTIYRPLAKDSRNKFRKNNITADIMGWSMLPFVGDVVFITSSMKDILTLDLLGFNAIAPHTEKAAFPPEKMLELKTAFKRIIVVYDNDSTGVKNSIKMVDDYDLEYWNVPKGLKFKDSDKECKDPSDVSMNYGLEYLSNIIKERIY